MTTKYQHEQFGDLIATDISSEEPMLPEVLALLYSGDCELARQKLSVMVRDYAAMCAESRMRRAA